MKGSLSFSIAVLAILSVLPSYVLAQSALVAGNTILAQQNGVWGIPFQGGFTPLSSISQQSLTKLLGGAGGGPHPVCVAWMQMKPPPQPPPPCFEPSFTALGNVVGVCTPATLCKGVSAPGLGGDSLGLGGSLGGIVGQLFSGILQKLMQPSQPESPQTPSNPYVNELQCSIYSTVATSTASSATYALSWTSSGTSASISPQPGKVAPNGSQQVVAPTLTTFFLTVTGGDGKTTTCSSAGSSSSGSSSYYGQSSSLSNVSDLLSGLTGGSTSDLLTGLGTGETNPVSDILSQFQFPAKESASTQPGNTPVFASTTALSQGVFTQQGGLKPAGATGDIVVFEGGATIVVGTNDPSKNSQTVGFLGTNTFGGQTGIGLAGELCQNRPWASNFLSYVVPATFFDGLCAWRGYKVGAPEVPATPQVTVTQTKPLPVQPASAATQPATPAVEAKVDVWAVPASVPLGARTSVFWNTQGVASCVVSSPDGSFNQTSLSGGASTVPLTGATTFTISCLKEDGTPITDYVTVNLAI